MPDTPQKITVALELGSSKARAMAGTKREDGSIEILATAEQESSSFIRRGIVHNIDRTSECIKVLVDTLQDQLGKKITKIYAGISGQSLHGVAVTTKRTFNEPTKIDESIQLNIDEEAYTKGKAGYNIIEYIPQEYIVGTSREIDPKGIVTKEIEGNYINVMIKEDRRKNLEDSINQAKMETADILITPKLLAKHALTEDEQNKGCALVDIGDQTTTVVICKRGIIRHIIVIPLGATNIANDVAYIAGVELSEAREIMHTHGDASNPIDTQVSQLKSSDGKPIVIKDVNDYISARVDEIAINVKNQLLSTRYGYELSSGIVLTGGGSKLKNIDEAFKRHFECNIKIRQSICHNIIGDTSIMDGFHNGVLSILANAALSMHAVDCVEEEKKNEIKEEPTTEEFNTNTTEENISAEPQKEINIGYENTTKPTGRTAEEIAEEQRRTRLKIQQRNKEINDAWNNLENKENATENDYKDFLNTYNDAPENLRLQAKERIKELKPKSESVFSKFFGSLSKKVKGAVESVMDEGEDQDEKE